MYKLKLVFRFFLGLELKVDVIILYISYVRGNYGRIKLIFKNWFKKVM